MDAALAMGEGHTVDRDGSQVDGRMLGQIEQRADIVHGHVGVEDDGNGLGRRQRRHVDLLSLAAAPPEPGGECGRQNQRDGRPGIEP